MFSFSPYKDIFINYYQFIWSPQAKTKPPAFKPFNTTNEDCDDDSDDFDPLPKIVDGGFAGIIGWAAVYPLDTMVTRLQNQQVGPSGRLMYTSLTQALFKIIRTEGFIGLYRGCLLNSVLILPESALKLTTNDFMRYALKKEHEHLPLWKGMVAGGLAGAAQLIVTTPMELLKIQLQDHGRSATVHYDHPDIFTPRTVVREILREKGVLGLYKGFQSTAMREICFSVMYYPLFSLLVERILYTRTNCEPEPAWVHFVGGLLAGSWAAFAVTPIDVMKTRIQTYHKAKGDREFTGMMDCFHTTLRFEGWRAFFKGGLCRVLMIAPLFGITQFVYELGINDRLKRRIQKTRAERGN